MSKVVEIITSGVEERFDSRVVDPVLSCLPDIVKNFSGDMSNPNREDDVHYLREQGMV